MTCEPFAETLFRRIARLHFLDLRKRDSQEILWQNYNLNLIFFLLNSANISANLSIWNPESAWISESSVTSCFRSHCFKGFAFCLDASSLPGRSQSHTLRCNDCNGIACLLRMIVPCNLQDLQVVPSLLSLEGFRLVMNPLIGCYDQIVSAFSCTTVKRFSVQKFL